MRMRKKLCCLVVAVSLLFDGYAALAFVHLMEDSPTKPAAKSSCDPEKTKAHYPWAQDFLDCGVCLSPEDQHRFQRLWTESNFARQQTNIEDKVSALDLLPPTKNKYQCRELKRSSVLDTIKPAKNAAQVRARLLRTLIELHLPLEKPEILALLYGNILSFMQELKKTKQLPPWEIYESIRLLEPQWRLKTKAFQSVEDVKKSPYIAQLLGYGPFFLPFKQIPEGSKANPLTPKEKEALAQLHGHYRLLPEERAMLLTYLRKYPQRRDKLMEVLQKAPKHLLRKALGELFTTQMKTFKEKATLDGFKFNNKLEDISQRHVNFNWEPGNDTQTGRTRGIAFDALSKLHQRSHRRWFPLKAFEDQIKRQLGSETPQFKGSFRSPTSELELGRAAAEASLASDLLKQDFKKYFAKKKVKQNQGFPFPLPQPTDLSQLHGLEKEIALAKERIQFLGQLGKLKQKEGNDEVHPSGTVEVPPRKIADIADQYLSARAKIVDYRIKEIRKKLEHLTDVTEAKQLHTLRELLKREQSALFDARFQNKCAAFGQIQTDKKLPWFTIRQTLSVILPGGESPQRILGRIRKEREALKHPSRRVYTLTGREAKRTRELRKQIQFTNVYLKLPIPPSAWEFEWNDVRQRKNRSVRMARAYMQQLDTTDPAKARNLRHRAKGLMNSSQMYSLVTHENQLLKDDVLRTRHLFASQLDTEGLLWALIDLAFAPQDPANAAFAPRHITSQMRSALRKLAEDILGTVPRTQHELTHWTKHARLEFIDGPKELSQTLYRIEGSIRAAEEGKIKLNFDDFNDEDLGEAYALVQGVPWLDPARAMMIASRLPPTYQNQPYTWKDIHQALEVVSPMELCLEAWKSYDDGVPKFSDLLTKIHEDRSPKQVRLGRIPVDYEVVRDRFYPHYRQFTQDLDDLVTQRYLASFLSGESPKAASTVVGNAMKRILDQEPKDPQRISFAKPAARALRDHLKKQADQLKDFLDWKEKTNLTTTAKDALSEIPKHIGLKNLFHADSWKKALSHATEQFKKSWQAPPLPRWVQRELEKQKRSPKDSAWQLSQLLQGYHNLDHALTEQMQARRVTREELKRLPVPEGGWRADRRETFLTHGGFVYYGTRACFVFNVSPTEFLSQCADTAVQPPQKDKEERPKFEIGGYERIYKFQWKNTVSLTDLQLERLEKLPDAVYDALIFLLGKHMHWAFDKNGNRHCYVQGSDSRSRIQSKLTKHQLTQLFLNPNPRDIFQAIYHNDFDFEYMEYVLTEPYYANLALAGDEEILESIKSKKIKEDSPRYNAQPFAPYSQDDFDDWMRGRNYRKTTKMTDRSCKFKPGHPKKVEGYEELRKAFPTLTREGQFISIQDEGYAKYQIERLLEEERKQQKNKQKEKNEEEDRSGKEKQDPLELWNLIYQLHHEINPKYARSDSFEPAGGVDRYRPDWIRKNFSPPNWISEGYDRPAHAAKVKLIHNQLKRKVATPAYWQAKLNNLSQPMLDMLWQMLQRQNPPSQELLSVASSLDPKAIEKIANKFIPQYAEMVTQAPLAKLEDKTKRLSKTLIPLLAENPHAVFPPNTSVKGDPGSAAWNVRHWCDFVQWSHFLSKREELEKYCTAEIQDRYLAYRKDKENNKPKDTEEKSFFDRLEAGEHFLREEAIWNYLDEHVQDPFSKKKEADSLPPEELMPILQALYRPKEPLPPLSPMGLKHLDKLKELLPSHSPSKEELIGATERALAFSVDRSCPGPKQNQTLLLPLWNNQWQKLWERWKSNQTTLRLETEAHERCLWEYKKKNLEEQKSWLEEQIPLRDQLAALDREIKALHCEIVAEDNQWSLLVGARKPGQNTAQAEDCRVAQKEAWEEQTILRSLGEDPEERDNRIRATEFRLKQYRRFKTEREQEQQVLQIRAKALQGKLLAAAADPDPPNCKQPDPQKKRKDFYKTQAELLTSDRSHPYLSEVVGRFIELMEHGEMLCRANAIGEPNDLMMSQWKDQIKKVCGGQYQTIAQQVCDQTKKETLHRQEGFRAKNAFLRNAWNVHWDGENFDFRNMTLPVGDHSLSVLMRRLNEVVIADRKRMGLPLPSPLPGESLKRELEMLWLTSGKPKVLELKGFGNLALKMGGHRAEFVDAKKLKDKAAEKLKLIASYRERLFKENGLVQKCRASNDRLFNDIGRLWNGSFGKAARFLHVDTQGDKDCREMVNAMNFLRQEIDRLDEFGNLQVSDPKDPNAKGTGVAAAARRAVSSSLAKNTGPTQAVNDTRDLLAFQTRYLVPEMRAKVVQDIFEDSQKRLQLYMEAGLALATSLVMPASIASAIRSGLFLYWGGVTVSEGLTYAAPTLHHWLPEGWMPEELPAGPLSKGVVDQRLIIAELIASHLATPLIAGGLKANQLRLEAKQASRLLQALSSPKLAGLWSWGLSTYAVRGAHDHYKGVPWAANWRRNAAHALQMGLLNVPKPGIFFKVLPYAPLRFLGGAAWMAGYDQIMHKILPGIGLESPAEKFAREARHKKLKAEGKLDEIEKEQNQQGLLMFLNNIALYALAGHHTVQEGKTWNNMQLVKSSLDLVGKNATYENLVKLGLEKDVARKLEAPQEKIKMETALEVANQKVKDANPDIESDQAVRAMAHMAFEQLDGPNFRKLIAEEQGRNLLAWTVGVTPKRLSELFANWLGKGVSPSYALFMSKMPAQVSRLAKAELKEVEKMESSPEKYEKRVTLAAEWLQANPSEWAREFPIKRLTPDEMVALAERAGVHAFNAGKLNSVESLNDLRLFAKFAYKNFESWQQLEAAFLEFQHDRWWKREQARKDYKIPVEAWVATAPLAELHKIDPKAWEGLPTDKKIDVLADRYAIPAVIMKEIYRKAVRDPNLKGKSVREQLEKVKQLAGAHLLELFKGSDAMKKAWDSKTNVVKTIAEELGLEERMVSRALQIVTETLREEGIALDYNNVIPLLREQLIGHLDESNRIFAELHARKIDNLEGQLESAQFEGRFGGPSDTLQRAWASRNVEQASAALADELGVDKKFAKKALEKVLADIAREGKGLNIVQATPLIREHVIGQLREELSTLKKTKDSLHQQTSDRLERLSSGIELLDRLRSVDSNWRQHFPLESQTDRETILFSQIAKVIAAEEGLYSPEFIEFARDPKVRAEKWTWSVLVDQFRRKKESEYALAG